MADATENLWKGSMSEEYDRLLGPVLFAPYADDLAARGAALGGHDVLEIAAGSGVVTSRLRAALPESAIVATDVNEAMVAYGESHVAGATWRQADACDLPFDADSFDLLVCQFGAMFFPDKAKAMREAYRVLRPGGHFVFSVWDEIERNVLSRATFDELTALFPDDPPTFATRIPHGFHQESVLRSVVADADLELLELATVELVARAASVVAFARGLCYGTPVKFEIAQRGDVDETAAALSAALVARLGDGPVEGLVSARVVTTRRPT